MDLLRHTVYNHIQKQLKEISQKQRVKNVNFQSSELNLKKRYKSFDTMSDVSSLNLL